MKGISAVFFDAVGTLIEIRGSVGKVYRDIAVHYGIDVDPRDLDLRFKAAFLGKVIARILFTDRASMVARTGA